MRTATSHPALFTCVETPIGELLLAGDGRSISSLAPVGDGARQALKEGAIEDPSAFSDARSQLVEYFDGVRAGFDLELIAEGTEFQRSVWRELCEIPYGQTRSYSEIAIAVGLPGAARAVGSANARNPITVIVPCHRVIAADGGLGGYSGGCDRKLWLLDHERSAARKANSSS